MRVPASLAFAGCIAFAAPALAQHSGHAAPAQAQPAPSPPPAAPDPHAGHNMGAPSQDQRVGGAQDPQPTPADPHAGHDVSATPDAANGQPVQHGTGGTALPAGDAPAPAAPEPNYADRIWGREAMEPARAALRSEHGGAKFTQVLFNLAEYQVQDGRDAFRWDGEAFYGGDINRVALRTEGTAAFGEGVEDAEVQLLYSRTVGPYTFVQAGVRYDIEPNPSRAYLSVGVETLLPYWFDVEGTLFLSEKGDVLARAEAYYDQRITQRLILQPRAELNLAAQDVPETGVGSGLSEIELGLRLRYEIKREFAPYIGVSYDRELGDTARFSRARGEDVGSTSFVVGLRAWF